MTVEVIVGPTCIATQGRTPRFAENATNRGADYGADGTGNDQCLEVARTEMVAYQAGRQALSGGMVLSA
jgi:hypothetical protein